MEVNHAQEESCDNALVAERILARRRDSLKGRTDDPKVATLKQKLKHTKHLVSDLTTDKEQRKDAHCSFSVHIAEVFFRFECFGHMTPVESASNQKLSPKEPFLVKSPD